MSTLKVRAKVRLVSEEDMELEDMDMGLVAKSKEWVWRSAGVLVEEIYKITSYSSNKSILHMYDGEKMLVAEPFDDLYQRWNQAVLEMKSFMAEEIILNPEDESFDEGDKS